MTVVATVGPGFKETIICDSVLQLKVCWREGGYKEWLGWLLKREMRSREGRFHEGKKRHGQH